MSRFVNELSAVNTRAIFAPGAIECAHSTSRVVSNCQLPAIQPLVAVQVAEPFGKKIWKFELVRAGSPFSSENRLASDAIVFDPNASTITIVWPLPSSPLL